MATSKQARYIGKLCSVKEIPFDQLCKQLGVSAISPGYLSFEQADRAIKHLLTLESKRGYKRNEFPETPKTKTEATQPEATPTPTIPADGSLAAVIAEHVKPYIDKSQAETIDVLMAELESRIGVKEIVIKRLDGKTIPVGKQHKEYEKLLQLVGLRINVWLKGPAGSGKTTAAKNVAKALGLDFYPVSVGPQTSKSDLFGYTDAHGKYVPSLLFTAYTKGGVFLLDEVDAANPGVLTAINAAVENDTCGFPHGVFARHSDFICIAAGNTFGTGADAQYVGRNQLDAATLDRFTSLIWEYDEKLEYEFVTAIAGTSPDVRKWIAYVQAMRSKANNLKLRVVISPRATRDGAKMLATGWNWSDVEVIALRKAISSDDWAKLQ